MNITGVNIAVHENQVDYKKISEGKNTVDKKEKDNSGNDLNFAVHIANEVLSKGSTRLKFEIYGISNSVVVKVLNNETGEVIREIPPEKIIDMIDKFCEMAGILVDERR
ncbi:MAG: flagellar protein FlaG [Clostridiales bacterium]|nr:flagellar protein FlaG [Clostridiales bacterium]